MLLTIPFILGKRQSAPVQMKMFTCSWYPLVYPQCPNWKQQFKLINKFSLMSFIVFMGIQYTFLLILLFLNWCLYVSKVWGFIVSVRPECFTFFINKADLIWAPALKAAVDECERTVLVVSWSSPVVMWDKRLKWLRLSAVWFTSSRGSSNSSTFPLCGALRKKMEINHIPVQIEDRTCPTSLSTPSAYSKCSRCIKLTVS